MVVRLNSRSRGRRISKMALSWDPAECCATIHDISRSKENCEALDGLSLGNIPERLSYFKEEITRKYYSVPAKRITCIYQQANMSSSI